jgi:hypothetical protein
MVTCPLSPFKKKTSIHLLHRPIIPIGNMLLPSKHVASQHVFEAKSAPAIDEIVLELLCRIAKAGAVHAVNRGLW